MAAPPRGQTVPRTVVVVCPYVGPGLSGLAWPGLWWPTGWVLSAYSTSSTRVLEYWLKRVSIIATRLGKLSGACVAQRVGFATVGAGAGFAWLRSAAHCSSTHAGGNHVPAGLGESPPLGESIVCR